MNRFLCWKLNTACFIGYIYVIITAVFALVLRLVDLIATGSDFEISQGFHTAWRSHFWQAFLASDVVLTILHVFIVLFSGFMILQVRERHFVMYMGTHKMYIILFSLYIIVEFTFSVFEYTYYGLNSFRLAFVVFTWLFWLFRTIVNIIFTIVLFARRQEMSEQMEMELRFAGVKKRHGYR